MTPAAFMAARSTRLRMVIFDCDGVLIDSEGLSNRLVAEALTELGWPMTQQDSEKMFLGMTLPDMTPLIEARLGRPIPAGWKDILAARMVERLGQEVEAIEGAEAALRETSAMGLPWRVASNSSHAEMAAKFGCTGLSALVAGRLHSYRDVPRGKPAPDLFLAAAAAEGIAPAACVVIEDSVTGTTGARAAGMDVLGYAPHGDAMGLAAAGAMPFRTMAELPALLRIGMTSGRMAAGDAEMGV